MTSKPPLLGGFISDPGPFAPVEIWEAFLAELQDMPDFILKEEMIADAKRLIAQKKEELRAQRHGVRWLH